MRRVINATGVIIHTNLGRAPLSDEAREALISAAGYCNIEYDLAAGKRGKRGERVETILKELTGADDALVVNNCAAAAFFVLTVLASGREVVISRGELVEIGGDFRVPDVLARSGAVLREVGTTNRTKLADYDKAIGDATALILKVHPSNYRIVGFTSAPSTKELVELARKREILVYEDAGSGVTADLGKLGLSGEPIVRDSIAAGVDIVTFSGDKLLGGPQAGMIVGRTELIQRLRRDPLYRVLRVDKLTCAALEATLEAHVRGNAGESVPALMMLAASEREIEARARAFVSRLSNPLLTTELFAGNSAVGGGSAPMVQPATCLIAVQHRSNSALELEKLLRQAATAVISRISEGKVLLDLRTVSRAEEDELADILNSI
jgi:L-seryl-tRNA(Ser) seleniumtransferase